MMHRLRGLLAQLPTRLHFAAIGAIGCLAAAVALELVYLGIAMPWQIDERAVRALTFHDTADRRSTPENLRSGDIQITLRWNNRNDLDLSCIDPNGDKIWYNHMLVPSSGQLDIDSNAGSFLTSHPVENIFWPYDSAPAGRYQVFVNYYARHGDADPTPYTVRVLKNGVVKNYSGTLEFGDDPRLITTFEESGGPVRFLGIRTGAWYVAIVVGFWFALAAGLLAFSLIEAQGAWLSVQRPLRRHVGAGPGRRPGETGVRGPVRRWLRDLGGRLRDGRVAAVAQRPATAAMGAFAIGLCSQLVFGAATEHDPTWSAAGRLLGWIVCAALVALAVARAVPRLPRFAAAVAGGLAGAVAAVLINAIPATASDAPARLLGAALFGAALGVLLYLERPVLEPEEEEAVAAVVLQAMRLRPYRLSGGPLVGAGSREDG